MGQSIDCQPHFGHQVGRRKASSANHAAQVGEKTAVCLLSDRLLVFKVRTYVDQLTTISREGNLWIVPGPPPAHLVGATEMNPATFLSRVAAYSGQGLFI